MCFIHHDRIRQHHHRHHYHHFYFVFYLFYFLSVPKCQKNQNVRKPQVIKRVHVYVLFIMIVSGNIIIDIIKIIFILLGVR